MSSRSKGRAFELRTKRWLEEEGWLVEIVKGGSGWQKSTDFWGWADIIALHPGRSFIRLIQCKGGKRWYQPSSAQRALISHFMANQPYVHKEWWMWRDRHKNPRIIQL